MILNLDRRVWEGVFIAGLGAGILALIPSQVDAVPGMETNMSPSFLPRIVGITLVIVGLAVSSLSAVGKRKEKNGGPVLGGFSRVIYSAALLLLYTFLFPIIGFVTTSAVFIGIFSFLYGQRNPLKLAAVMMIIPILVWVLFEIIFVIPLPHGFLY